MTDCAFRLTMPGTNQALAKVNGSLVGDGHAFEQLDHGIWDLLLPDTRPVLDQFAQGYARVREAEGRALSADQVRALPAIEADHALATMWRQRKNSFDLFHGWVRTRPDVPADPTVIDIGAGCGWLAAHLHRDGWQAAALDITVDGGDGLAAARHHPEKLLLIRAEMGALPFATNSVDLAVFNASLHYAADVSGALAEARRVVRPHGYLAVLDSPIFNDPAAGRAMVHEFAVSTERTHGFEPPAHLGSGFVTWEQVEQFGFAPIVMASGPRARFHQWRGARRAGREVAQRPQLVAQSAASGVMV